MLDSHCHLDDPRLAADLDDVLARARDAGVHGFIVPGVRPDQQDRLDQIVASHSNVYPTSGIHPWTVSHGNGAEISSLLEIVAQRLAEGCVALGEVGLDRSGTHSSLIEPQKGLLRLQLDLARSRDIPVIFHVVRAHGHLIEMLRSDKALAAGGVIHAFSGALDVARTYLDLGLHLSFGPAILDERAKKARAAVAGVPADKLLIETDAPFQHPRGKTERNEPMLLQEVVREVARIRGVSATSLGDRTAENARRLFRLPAA